MTDFALRGTFYLGDSENIDIQVKQADHIMDHLLDVEQRSNGAVRDAAVSLDAGTHTVEVELIVTAETMLSAHQLASEAVDAAFSLSDGTQERSIELVPA